MEYTYSSYFSLMNSLKEHEYSLVTFVEAKKSLHKNAIIRHDVDVDPVCAAKFGSYEEENGIRSTYFVMASSCYYNLLSKKNRNSIESLIENKHEIGLHFDVTNYNSFEFDKMIEKIAKEKEIIEKIFDINIKSLSWHIPRKDLIGKHIQQIDDLGLLNAYDPEFYYGYKYVSDSMMRWREPVEKYVAEEAFEQLQILTHPIWYKEESTLSDIQILNESLNLKNQDNIKYIDSIRPGFKDLL